MSRLFTLFLLEQPDLLNVTFHCNITTTQVMFYMNHKYGMVYVVMPCIFCAAFIKGHEVARKVVADDVRCSVNQEL